MVPVNYLAVIVSAVVAIVLGFLWYGPIFGKKWTAMIGWTPERISAMRADPKMKNMVMRNYALVGVGALIMAFVMSHAIVFAGAYMNVSGVSAGLQAGFWNWLGFVAPVTLGAVLWEGKPWMLWVLNAGYYLVSLLLMGLILGMWM